MMVQVGTDLSPPGRLSGAGVSLQESSLADRRRLRGHQGDDHERRGPARWSTGIDQLSRELQASSTPIRESLVRLESEGLARREALRGYTVTALLDRAQVDELFEFRGDRTLGSGVGRAARTKSDLLARLSAEVDSVMSLPSDDSGTSPTETWWPTTSGPTLRSPRCPGTSKHPPFTYPLEP